MTTCGYGDIHPYSTNERMSTMMAMLISSIVFGYVIAEIGRIVRNFNVLAANFREKINYVERFLRKKEIPNSLRL